MKKKLSLLRTDELITIKGGNIFCNCLPSCGGEDVRFHWKVQPKDGKPGPQGFNN